MGQKHYILILDSSGRPYRWASWELGIKIKVKNMIAWSLGNEEIYYGGYNRVTNSISQVALPSIIAVKNVHKNKNHVAIVSNRLLFERDGYVCAYCKKKHNHRLLTRDHIIPLSKGGTDSWTNIVTACMDCNAKKSDKTLAEAKLSLHNTPTVVSKAKELLLTNKAMLEEQRELLKNYI
jgi:hypothetical protein